METISNELTERSLGLRIFVVENHVDMLGLDSERIHSSQIDDATSRVAPDERLDLFERCLAITVAVRNPRTDLPTTAGPLAPAAGNFLADVSLATSRRADQQWHAPPAQYS